MVNVSCSARKSFEVLQWTVQCEDLWHAVSSLSSNQSTHHQHEQQNHRAMKYIPARTNFSSLVDDLLILRVTLWRQFSPKLWSAAQSCWLMRLVLSTMYYHQSDLLDSKLLIRVMQWSIRRVNCSGLVPCLLLMLSNWAVFHTCSLAVLYFSCVVKPTFRCQIPIVPSMHLLTPTPVIWAQMQMCRGGIWIVFVSVTTNCSN